MKPAGGALPAWVEPQLQMARQAPALTARHLAAMANCWASRRSNGRTRAGCPAGRSMSAFETPLFFSGLPLIARDAGRDARCGLIGDRGVPLLLKSVPIDGPFWDTLCRAARRLNAPIEIIDAVAARRFADPMAAYEAWFETNFERKRRKEYRRLRARLGELGKLESRQLAVGRAARPWFDEFVRARGERLEGPARQRHRLRQQALSACLAEALDRLAAAGQLRFWSITLDGQAIATLFAIVVGEQRLARQDRLR